jgi:ABC-type polysaccharide/polyol phosphate export permease
MALVIWDWQSISFDQFYIHKRHHKKQYPLQTWLKQDFDTRHCKDFIGTIWQIITSIATLLTSFKRKQMLSQQGKHIHQ